MTYRCIMKTVFNSTTAAICPARDRKKDDYIFRNAVLATESDNEFSTNGMFRLSDFAA